jgi:tRNA dimethylallyltransferase
MEIKSYIIAGPTACGKSDFAHSLARRVGGVVINCDSVQIYKGIENISASPFAGRTAQAEKQELDGVPYRLYSITGPTEPLSAGQWAGLAREEYNAAISAGRPAVFAGGAGFYLTALTDGLSDIPPVRALTREAAGAMPDGHEFLTKHDPDLAARISPNDRQRISRGIEVFLETGRPLSWWQKQPRKSIFQGDGSSRAIKILILPPKEITLQRIAERMPALDANSENEVRALMNLPPGLPVMRADGVFEIASYLRGETTREAAMEAWRRKIERGNMKRQYTWFRTQFSPDITIPRIPSDEDLEMVLGK